MTPTLYVIKDGEYFIGVFTTLQTAIDNLSKRVEINYPGVKYTIETNEATKEIWFTSEEGGAMDVYDYLDITPNKIYFW